MFSSNYFLIITITLIISSSILTTTFLSATEIVGCSTKINSNLGKVTISGISNCDLVIQDSTVDSIEFTDDVVSDQSSGGGGTGTKGGTTITLKNISCGDKVTASPSACITFSGKVSAKSLHIESVTRHVLVRQENAHNDLILHKAPVTVTETYSVKSCSFSGGVHGGTGSLNVAVFRILEFNENAPFTAGSFDFVNNKIPTLTIEAESFVYVFGARFMQPVSIAHSFSVFKNEIFISSTSSNSFAISVVDAYQDVSALESGPLVPLQQKQPVNISQNKVSGNFLSAGKSSPSTSHTRIACAWFHQRVLNFDQYLVSNNDVSSAVTVNSIGSIVEVVSVWVTTNNCNANEHKKVVEQIQKDCSSKNAGIIVGVTLGITVVVIFINVLVYRHFSNKKDNGAARSSGQDDNSHAQPMIDNRHHETSSTASSGNNNKLHNATHNHDENIYAKHENKPTQFAYASPKEILMPSEQEHQVQQPLKPLSSSSSGREDSLGTNDL